MRDTRAYCNGPWFIWGMSQCCRDIKGSHSPMNVISPILNAKVCDKIVKKRHENERGVDDIEDPTKLIGAL